MKGEVGNYDGTERERQLIKVEEEEIGSRGIKKRMK